MLLDLKIKLLAKGNSLNFLNNNKYFTKHFLQNVSEYETILYLIQEETHRLLSKSLAISFIEDEIEVFYINKKNDAINIKLKDDKESDVHKFIFIKTRECFNSSVLHSRNYVNMVFYITLPKYKDKEETGIDALERGIKYARIDIDYHGNVSTKRSDDSANVTCLYSETTHGGLLLRLIGKYNKGDEHINRMATICKEFNIKETEKILEYVENLKII